MINIIRGYAKIQYTLSPLHLASTTHLFALARCMLWQGMMVIMMEPFVVRTSADIQRRGPTNQPSIIVTGISPGQRLWKWWFYFKPSHHRAYPVINESHHHHCHTDSYSRVRNSCSNPICPPPNSLPTTHPPRPLPQNFGN